MVAFSDRPLCYQVGVFLLLLATAMFSVGLALPWWAQTYSDANDIVRHSGLWIGCSSDSSENCSPIDAPGWFKAVQGLQVVALLGMVVACAYAVFANCCLDQPTYSRTVEVTAGSGGLLGLVSAMLYVAKTSHILRKSRHISYSWAFGIDVAACVLVTFIAAIIALSNSRHVVGGRDDTRLIIDEAGAGSGSRHRSRSRGAGRGREIEMERSPVRTRRLGGTSGSCREVIVLQNNFGVDLDRPRPDGNGSSGTATATILGPTPCACCRSQRQSTFSTTSSGHCKESRPCHCKECEPCHGHVNCYCKGHDCTHFAEHSSDCHSASTRAKGPYTEMPTKASFHAASNRHSSCEPNESKPSVLPPVCSSCCSCSTRMSAPPHSGVTVQGDCGKFNDEKIAPKAHTLVKADCPERAVATAPPLEAEYGDRVDFATAQYFVNSETVFVGDAPRREQ